MEQVKTKEEKIEILAKAHEVMDRSKIPVIMYYLAHTMVADMLDPEDKEPLYRHKFAIQEAIKDANQNIKVLEDALAQTEKKLA